eukprot:scaffold2529_cov363-Prasinococcus_capsulatus_cf.AAC.18
MNRGATADAPAPAAERGAGPPSPAVIQMQPSAPANRGGRQKVRRLQGLARGGHEQSPAVHLHAATGATHTPLSSVAA